MRRFTMTLAILALSGAIPAIAAPPGPPTPGYVFDAEKLLAATPELPSAQVASLFAEDVTVSENGETVARGKTAWLVWRTKQAGEYYGTHWGYSAGYGPNYSSGALMILDTFDTFDPKRHMSSGAWTDPRFVTRSILYRFGEDKLIHSVLILDMQGMWEPLPR